MGLRHLVNLFSTYVADSGTKSVPHHSMSVGARNRDDCKLATPLFGSLFCYITQII